MVSRRFPAIWRCCIAIINTFKRKKAIQMKKICLTLAAMSIFLTASAALFAQGTIITDDTVKNFVALYADVSEEALQKAAQELGPAVEGLNVVAGKISAIYQLKAAGANADQLLTQVQKMEPPYNTTAEEIAVYNAHESEINPTMERLLKFAQENPR
jgi:uncharacterized iron-regulated protein